MPPSIVVTNISPETSKDDIARFFSFCGKIQNLDITEGPTTTAVITFQQTSAMKTALLLNNTQLGPNQVEVQPSPGEQSATAGSDDEHDHHHHQGAGGSSSAESTGEFSQEEKPRSRIFAEYLASGYVVADATISRALELDSKHGVSASFLGTLQQMNEKYHASDRARAADESYGITNRAGSWLQGLGSYFEKATNTSTGARIVKFYTESQKQVQDVHAEAMRLKELKKQAAGGSAVRAAGLERVLGKDAAGTDNSSGTQSSQPTAGTTAIPAVTPGVSSAGAGQQQQQQQSQPTQDLKH